MIRQDILDIFRLKPGKKVRLKDHDTGPSSSHVPSNGVPSSGSPLSATDQLFANLDSILSDARNAYQAVLSSATAPWQSDDTLALQRLDVLMTCSTIGPSRRDTPVAGHFRP